MMIQQPTANKLVSQLTLDFEPAITERFGTLREYVSHCVNTGALPAKSIAADMDIGTSTLSRKLSPSEGDTQRLNVDDLENYMRVTGDIRPLAYLAAKFGETDTMRQHRLLKRLETFMNELPEMAAAIKACQ
jgi:hypothetical protein